MEIYASRDEYIKALTLRAGLPRGFQAATAELDFLPKEIPVKKPYRMSLALLTLDRPSPSFAAVFTRNSFPGAPVIIGKKRLGQKNISGVLINNKISNVCAEDGVKNAGHILAELGGLTGFAAEQYFCASTGIIGWRLPVPEIIGKLPELVSSLDNSSLLPAAGAIMTTDAYPKIREARIGAGRIVGIAKGAGMIEPNMATMLVFLLTDISIDRPLLQQALQQACAESFNTISVDGDQSTSDMALIFSSNMVPLTSVDEFTGALTSVCRQLASDIVRNGEGVSHVIQVKTVNAPDRETAAAIGKTVCNSNLVKTAVFGNDPNVGRIISAIGDYAGTNDIPLDFSRLLVRLGNQCIFTEGCFCLDTGKEKLLADYLAQCAFDNSSGYPSHNRSVELRIDLGMGSASATVTGADLSYGYIKENAMYRS